MKNLYIIGCGELARELYCHFLCSNLIEQFEFQGFIAQESGSISINNIDLPILLEQNIESLKENSEFIFGIGNPKIIDKIYSKNQNLIYTNLIHTQSTFHPESCKIGQGNSITAGVRGTTNIDFGKNNYFNLNVTIGHDCKFGKNNVINPGVNISGNTKIGDNCLIGTGATILQGIAICSNVILGANSLLTKDAKEPGVYVGTPAKLKG